VAIIDDSVWKGLVDDCGGEGAVRDEYVEVGGHLGTAVISFDNV
jgi:translation initiation factor 1 (eIF-1/SUI1)